MLLILSGSKGQGIKKSQMDPGIATLKVLGKGPAGCGILPLGVSRRFLCRPHTDLGTVKHRFLTSKVAEAKAQIIDVSERQ